VLSLRKKAQMVKILEQLPRETVKVAEILHSFGFKITSCSIPYALSVFQQLNKKDMARIRESFIRNKYRREK
jgi:hypothetical protein